MLFAAVRWSRMALSGQISFADFCPLSDHSGQGVGFGRARFAR
jgi:hypothetical protein